MSLRTTQIAFSMLRRMRPSAAVTSPLSSSNVWNATTSTAISSKDCVRFLQTDVVHQKPSVDIAKMMPVGMSEMDNETLVTIAALGNHEARCEVLIRHIMSVDNIEYDEASETFVDIAQANRNSVNFAVYPYFFAMGLSMFAAVASLPMVFDLNTALLFNKDFVTTDVPEPRDLETMLEVGSWTWNWMEPPLGALSFSLLCLQYARSHLKNLGLHPYTTRLISRRADTLAAAYSQYDPIVIRQYSKSDPLVQ